MTENNIDMPLDMKVGEILRNARTLGRRKREISTISKQLCIKEEFLQALEDGNYKVIPETVYILGFARNYAVELGLDPDEIVNRIKKELGLLSDCEDEEETGIMGGACAVPGNDITEKKSNKKDFLTKIYKFIHKNWLWFTIGIAVFVIAIIALVIFLPKTSNESIETSTEVVQVSEVLEPKYKLDVRDRFGTENIEKAEVVLQANQESWVKVEDARGNTIFSRVLVPGDIYYVPVGEKYKATFGNAGGIDIWVNGKLAPKQGADHVRKSGIVMTAEALTAPSQNGDK